MANKNKSGTNLNPSEPSRTTLVGKQLGDYKLVSVLATGGMARIYEGIDQKLHRPAAVKVLELMDEAEDPKILTERFQREARAVAVLEHDNIISIYQYGESDGVYFLAMKLIRGKDLAQELKELRLAGKKMDPKRALHILGQVAEALDFAHAANVIHRDVKPSNILIDQKDKAYLTDFGLVLRPSVETTLGTAFGTPRYIAPEQAISSDKALPQSDIYSLAVILYEVLTDRTPFGGDTPMQIALGHISEPPPPPRSFNSAIPLAVEKELLRALEKEPEMRHRTASEFMGAIKRSYGVATTDPTPVTSPAAPQSAPKTKKVVTGPLSQPVKKTVIARGADEDDTAKLVPSKKRVLPGWFSALLLIAAILGALYLLNRLGIIQLPMGVIGSEGAAITLIYDEFTFSMINEGDYDLNMLPLRFVRGVDGDGDDYGGDRVRQDILPAGTCARVRLQTRQASSPPQCRRVHNEEQLQDPLRFFWRFEPGNTASFEVRFDGNVIARCETVRRGEAKECRFNWPVVPTPSPVP